MRQDPVEGQDSRRGAANQDDGWGRGDRTGISTMDQGKAFMAEAHGAAMQVAAPNPVSVAWWAPDGRWQGNGR